IGYHCNHTRQATPKHWETRADDWRTLVAEVHSPELPSQAEAWGCPQDTIEEVSLASCSSDVYRASLPQVIGTRMATFSKVYYREESFDHVKYDVRHVLPYLSDVFVNYPRNSSVGWFGHGSNMLPLFARMWKLLGFAGRVMVDPATPEIFPQVVSRL